MKRYTLLFSVLFIIAGCSNEWEELGFSESQEEKAKEMGFENPVDYKEALDLDISSVSDLLAYRNGGFNNALEFEFAQRFSLNSLEKVKEYKQQNCETTPTYGEVCTYDELFNELIPRFEYHQTRLNNAIDESKIEFALDCKSIKRSKSEFGGHFRTVLIKTNSNLIPLEQKKLMRHSFASMRGQKKDKYTNSDGYYNYIYYGSNGTYITDNIAILSFESYTKSYLRNDIRVDYETGSYMAIVDGSWLTDDDSYTFSTFAFSPILIDRKTGFGKRKRNPGDFSNVAESFNCKKFTGEVKNYLKDDNALTGAIFREVASQIDLLRGKKAEKLAKKKKEEERNKMENKF
tara:strand:+ start:812 stop:1852 length:1041 start_codon:yes stop_codon:yes gene_type:complete